MIRLAFIFRTTVLVVFLSVVGAAPLLAQVEICDNGLDDDNDGLVDLNDVADCICNGEATVPDASLVPNHSGETFLNCPGTHDEIWLAEDWWPVGWGTEDYFYDGCYLGFPDPSWMPYPPATPIPVGSGFFGCIFSAGENNPDVKEYLGTCLSSPMEGGKAYSMQFYLGFGVENDSPPWQEKYVSPETAEVAIYGYRDCLTEPYDLYSLDNAATHPGFQRCPTDYNTGWELLGTTIVEGEDEWVKARIDFNLPQGTDLNKFMIGATCETHPLKTYYFFDEFILNESHLFNVPGITILGEDPCFGATKLGTDMAGQNYQWYKNGVAIIGATAQEYDITYGEFGVFQVRVDDGTNCYLSATQEIVEQEIPILEIQKEICFGGTFNFRGLELTEAQIYTDTLLSFYGCDTLLFLEIIVTENTGDAVFPINCGMDNLNYGYLEWPNGAQGFLSYSLDGGNSFESFTFDKVLIQDLPQIVLIRDSRGCIWEDTIDMAYIDIKPLSPEDDFEIINGEHLPIAVETNLPNFYNVEWTPNTRISCDDCLDPDFFPNQTTDYTITIDYYMQCNISDTFTIVVLPKEEISDVEIYYPNAFSPNGDGANDRFTLYTNKQGLVVKLNFLRIFDNWGSMVFEQKDFPPNDTSFGWDGVFLGELMNPAVFIFFAEMLLIDGTTIRKTGTVTLVR